MAIKMEAAFHEAGHAVAAYFSKFHKFLGPVTLAKYGQGEIYVSQCKSKFSVVGKNVGAASQRDKEVATDLAIVLCSGLVAECLAEEKNSNICPNPECAEPDRELMAKQLELAGLSKKFDRHQVSATALLEKNWVLVSELADFLFEKEVASGEDISSLIEKKIASMSETDG